MKFRMCTIRPTHVAPFIPWLILAALAPPPASAQVASVVRLVATPNPVVQGQSVTFGTSVNAVGQATPSGTITLTDTVTCPGASSATVVVLGTITLGSVTSATPGAGTLVVPSFPCVGDNSIVAAYNGDSNYSAGSSQPLIVSVLTQFTPTSTALSSSSNPSTAGQNVTFSAQLKYTVQNNTYATGMVTFTDTNTGNVLGTASVQTSGTGAEVITAASITTSSLAAGSYAVRAAYTGNSIYAASTSPVVNQVVQQVAAVPTTLLAVTNSASYGKSSIAPGEIVTLFGTTMGPSKLAYYALDANNRIPASLAGSRVLINGIAAPLVYTSDKQAAAVVPFEVAGQSTAQIQVEFNGIASTPMTVPVTNTMPGVFSADASGSGQGAIQNADLSYNSAANPASPGSTIVLWVTGLGQLNPVPPDGSIVPDSSPVLSYPPTVTIAGQAATIVFSGPAPQAVAGLYQVNCVVPAGVASGPAPVVVTADGRSSQPSLTVAIR